MVTLIVIECRPIGQVILSQLPETKLAVSAPTCAVLILPNKTHHTFCHSRDSQTTTLTTLLQVGTHYYLGEPLPPTASAKSVTGEVVDSSEAGGDDDEEGALIVQWQCVSLTLVYPGCSPNRRMSMASSTHVAMRSVHCMYLRPGQQSPAVWLQGMVACIRAMTLFACSSFIMGRMRPAVRLTTMVRS